MTRTLLLTCLILVGSHQLSYSQRLAEVDSLLTLLREIAEDTNKIAVYHRLSYIYNFVQYKPELARPYADSAMVLSEQLDHNKSKIDSHYYLGLVDMNENIYEDALVHFNQYIDFYKARGDSSSVARALYCIASIHADRGEDDRNLALQLRLVKIYAQLGDRQRIASTLNGIGNVYWRTGKNDLAIDSYKQANTIYSSLNSLARYGMGLQNLANVYVTMEQYDTAKRYYLEALKLVREHGSDAEMSFILANLGDLHEELNDYRSALSYNLQALEIRRKSAQKRSLAATLIDVGHIYTVLNRYDEAMPSLNEGVEIANNIGAKSLIVEGYTNLSNLYKAKRDFENAYTYSTLSQQWKDSISSEESREQINKLQTLYETEKKDKQIVLLAKEKELQEKEAQRQASLKKVFLAGFILMLLSGGLGIYAFQQRLKNQKIVAAKNEEIRDITYQRQIIELEMKALRAQINPHFLFNCLNSINRMIVKGEYESASLYLKKFSKLVRLIVENVEGGRVSLENELALIESYIQLEELRFKGKIAYEISIDKDIERENTFLPPMVLQPFVENAIWHGLMHKDSEGHIRIAVKEDKDALLCTIEDNGVGRGKSKELQQKDEVKTKSLGIKITEERLRLMNKLKMDDLIRIVDLQDHGEATGTRVEISIPLA